MPVMFGNNYRGQHVSVSFCKVKVTNLAVLSSALRMEEEFVNLGIVAADNSQAENYAQSAEDDAENWEKYNQPNDELCQLLMERIQRALDEGEDLNSVYDGNKTLLSAAVEVNDLKAAKILLRGSIQTSVLSNLADAKYRLIVMRRETPLMTASRLGHTEMCRLLLEHGALVNDESELEADLGSALHWAANRGHLECVKLLVENHANLDARGGHGATALMEAVLEDSFSIIKYLVEAGADINLPLFVSEDDIEDTPLLVSMLLGQDNNVDYFIKSGSRLVLTDRVTDVIGTYTNFLIRARLKALITMIMMCGANISAKSLLVLDDLGYIQLDRDFHAWLSEVKRHPFNLSQIARIAVRRHLGSVYANRGMMHKIDLLPVPPYIQSYLKLDVM